MSGYPYAAGVAKVRAALLREAEIERRLGDIAASINTLTAEQMRLGEERVTLVGDRWKMMQAMDLTASGNAGYEGRMTWFLRTLVGGDGT